MKATFRIDSGETTDAAGTPTEYEAGPRMAKAIGFAVGGLVLGGVFIVVPLVHLITTWFLPLLGFYLAWTAFNKDRTFTGIQGACPACKADITLDGGRITPSMWDQCPACRRPVQILIEEA